jgi:hypothetical protein
MSRWIKADDAKPRISTPINAIRVVVFVPEMVDKYQDGYRFARWMGARYGWLIDGASGNWEVTHWMPLHPPTKGKR